MNSSERIDDAALAFLTESHVASLTTLRADGSPHVVAVGFTWDPTGSLARVITRGGSRKTVNARLGGRTAVCQVDGRRWITLEGPVTVSDDPQRVAEAVRLYSARYRPPRDDPSRVVLEIAVDRVLGSWG